MVIFTEASGFSCYFHQPLLGDAVTTLLCGHLYLDIILYHMKKFLNFLTKLFFFTSHTVQWQPGCMDVYVQCITKSEFESDIYTFYVYRVDI